MGGFTNLLRFSLFWFLTSLTFFTTISISADTLTTTQILRTNQTLISQNETFVLGFFPGSDSNWYVGIWYKNIDDRTLVWVANRDNPLEDSTGFLMIGDKGNIVIDNPSGNPVWSSNQTTANNPIVQLLDSGNLVVKEANLSDPTKYLWQSFDYPTDTLVPGMKMGWNLDTGMEKHITSWKNTGQDPSTGGYSFKIDYHGLPEIFLRNNQNITYRSGPWNGERFSGVPEMEPDTDSIVFTFSEDEHGVYYSFSIGNQSIFSRLIVTSDGQLQRLAWIQSSQTWNKFWYAPKDQCDVYRECGPYGICDSNASPVCECVRGFKPKNQQAWNLRDGSDGCVRNTNLECVSDKFLHMQNVKLPETTTAFVNRSMTLVECEDLCHRNCSCTAYANIEITNGGTGCVMWIGELIDMRQYSDGGQDLYLRLAASDVGGSHKTNDTGKVVGITLSAAVIILGLGFLSWKKRKLLLNGNTDRRGSLQRSQDLLMNEVVFSSKRENSGERNMDDLELPIFDFNTITMATNNFSEANKLGQGGFGIVYRGRLMEGQEIAVKRLSKTSGQGNEEFKNEVKLIVKLQHRNLVRLFGCCIDMDEKLLVYEYMENRGLDSILFDKAKRPLLNWRRRFSIICGIARGLLYLHHDSRFRIIHRDLKASNILLDSEMNPKISDFGMARIFGTDQTEANTLRVVGTYGYMAPEYAMDGNFSVKSDVFSFGVLVLEIISGKKNRGFYYSNNELNLLANVWKQWKEGSALELIDPSIGESYSPSEVLRCIHVGLLCVQERAEDRPTMSSVILMLSSETSLMPQPRNPGFSVGRNPGETDSSSSKQDEPWSVNQVTVTLLDAR
ncbi:receptor-like serine/threonine-protein kinase SD1-8 isoform X2 [Gastrolobium bilobum]|uniref:receptor-like serine/threonine-protein kinase SD1-8 isoform X2 n=1 Tax=Gastrolobium bilobum TaxID=150636 RepID=UPI002AAF1F3A|nr:receptor-like serine/threonine-protein kinase SD1-8 isoform X2 [Gastrolobium bilobum]